MNAHMQVGQRYDEAGWVDPDTFATAPQTNQTPTGVRPALPCSVTILPCPVLRCPAPLLAMACSGLVQHSYMVHLLPLAPNPSRNPSCFPPRVLSYLDNHPCPPSLRPAARCVPVPQVSPRSGQRPQRDACGRGGGGPQAVQSQAEPEGHRSSAPGTAAG